jgi:hypothetical protein
MLEAGGLNSTGHRSRLPRDIESQCAFLLATNVRHNRNQLEGNRAASPVFAGFQLPTIPASVAPSLISVSRARPRHITIFPGGGSLARAR